MNTCESGATIRELRANPVQRKGAARAAVDRLVRGAAILI